MEKQPKIQLPVPNEHGDDSYAVPEIIPSHKPVAPIQTWEDEDDWVDDEYEEDEYE